MASTAPIHLLSIVGRDKDTLRLEEFLWDLPGIELTGQATRAEDALEHLQLKHIDVVLLDLGVRDLQGIELTRQIRRLGKEVRVLVLTASHSVEDIFDALEAGADAYVLKDNFKGIEMAIRTVRLGAVWLDPGIATQVLEAMVNAVNGPHTRTLQTGVMTLPLMPDEKRLLDNVAAGTCVDGVCMIDPSFVKKLKRFAPKTA
jgi:DNA-binding NarL/FixJ family response regulator